MITTCNNCMDECRVPRGYKSGPVLCPDCPEMTRPIAERERDHASELDARDAERGEPCT